MRAKSGQILTDQSTPFVHFSLRWSSSYPSHSLAPVLGNGGAHNTTLAPFSV
ncbi:hypothetical protein BJV78DRAFT_1208545 [Lactifluus subvellereus]|nr:hypothetical protein BJV78DRAFT_1208545 [Lactifluus subvellereus]